MRRSYFIITNQDATGSWIAWAAIHDDSARAPVTAGGTAALEEEAIRIAVISARGALERSTLPPPAPRSERTTDRPPALAGTPRERRAPKKGAAKHAPAKSTTTNEVRAKSAAKKKR